MHTDIGDSAGCWRTSYHWEIEEDRETAGTPTLKPHFFLRSSSDIPLSGNQPGACISISASIAQDGLPSTNAVEQPCARERVKDGNLYHAVTICSALLYFPLSSPSVLVNGRVKI
ncbi:hypothetical protein J1614_000302 [Plenodomus biglobosus]|nr:hypothetical protein J1614_000302 [Plenodomus biglobosus]